MPFSRFFLVCFCWFVFVCVLSIELCICAQRAELLRGAGQRTAFGSIRSSAQMEPMLLLGDEEAANGTGGQLVFLEVAWRDVTAVASRPNGRAG